MLLIIVIKRRIRSSLLGSRAFAVNREVDELREKLVTCVTADDKVLL